METVFKVKKKQKKSRDYEREVIERKKCNIHMANGEFRSHPVHKHISAFSPSIMQDTSHDSLVGKW